MGFQTEKLMLGVCTDVLPALLGPGRSPTASLGRFHRQCGVLILFGELAAGYRIGFGPAVSDRPGPSSDCSPVIDLKKFGLPPLCVCVVIGELIYRGQTRRLVSLLLTSYSLFVILNKTTSCSGQDSCYFGQ